MQHSTARAQNCPEPELVHESRAPRARGTAAGSLWGWGAMSMLASPRISALQGPPPLAPSSWHQAGASAHVPPGFHVPPDPTWLSAVVCTGSMWQGLFWAGRAWCTRIPVHRQSPVGDSTGHPTASIPRDPLVTFSPFSPAPPSPTSTCGAERGCQSTRGQALAHGQGEGWGQSLRFVLGVQEAPERRVREAG